MFRKASAGFSSFLSTPSGVLVATLVVWHVVQWALGIPISWVASIVIFIIDMAVVFFLSDWLTYFFAQFVLPIHKTEERNEIYTRVRDFESGKRGPILFVKNGRVIEHEGEANKKGPGVIVLDSASAVVLRTDSEIVGAAGPGVRFTKGSEYIVKSLNSDTNQMESVGVDLRKQWHYFGLSASPPNPDPVKNPKAYNELERIRKQTAGLTRDGFEVYAHISIRFRIRRDEKNNEPTQSDVLSQFGFNSEAVTNAVTREANELNTFDNKKAKIKWKDLPEHLVVNLWREYVRKFKLEDLFTDTEKFSNLQIIEYKINQHVKEPRVNPLGDNGEPGGPGRQRPSREYAQLQARGLEITDVRIHYVAFDKEMEEKTVARWSNDWMRAAKQDEDLMKEKAALAETASRNDALKRFARVSTQKFETLTDRPAEPYSMLQDLVEPLKENLLQQNHAENQVGPILEHLDDIAKKLLFLKFEQARKHEGGEEK